MLVRIARRRRWFLKTVVVLLVLALPGAPIARSASITCSICPPDCPMHGKAKKRLKCHQSKASPAEARHAGCARTPGISLPGCGYHGDVLLGSLPPAIPPASPLSWRMASAEAPSPEHAAPCTRGADPPDTPPPIVSI
jgi:hypothetical protein